MEKILPRRPSGLLYSVNDLPRPVPLALLGLQHFIVIVPNLTIVLLIGRATGIDQEEIASMLSWSLIALAISTLAQCSTRFGSGFFIVSCNSAIYVSASLAAATGGFALVCGMTLLAGLFQVLFAAFLVRTRRYFPTEIVALSVIVVGLELGAIGLRRMSSTGEIGFIVGAITFGISVALGVYGRGTWRLYCSLIGIVIGYALSAKAGLIDINSFIKFTSTPVASLPELPTIRFEFEGSYVLPFMIAAIAASMKTMCAVVMSDQMNDESWVRPDLRPVRKGIIVDGFATALSGILGGVGTNSATSSVGVAQATGATSRAIGFAVSAWMIFFALSPAFTSVFVSMPDAVIGGGLLFVACIVNVNGFQMLSKVPMDMRRAGVISFPLILAISVASNAPPFSLLPLEIKPIVSSPLAMAIIAALLVNFLFSFGTKQSAAFEFSPTGSYHDHLASVGKTLDAWRVAPNVKGRVMLTLRELADHEVTSLKLKFDGYTLRLDLLRPHAQLNGSSEFFASRVSDTYFQRRSVGNAEVMTAFYEQ